VKNLGMIKKQKGFTLIEVILTIIIAAIAGSMLIAYVNTSMIKSSEPLGWLNAGLTLNQIMENIISDYENGGDILTLYGNVRTNSDATDCNGSSCDNDYGQYILLENKFIEFDGGGSETDEIPGATDPCEMLKVMISDPTGQKFTSLFTGSVICPP